MTDTLTPWGYDVTGTLPDILTLDEFNTLTGNRWAADPLAAQAVTAASDAVRNYCGWHVAPAMACTVRAVGGGRVLNLPWRGMRSVESVTVCGTVVPSTAYTWAQNGIIRRLDGFYWPHRWDIEVKATAGYDTPAILKQVCAQIAGNAIAAPMGVKEEHAGQVGITYNAAGGIAGGVTLTARDMACLDAFRVVGVA